MTLSPPSPPSPLSPADADKILAGNFAPWVLDLGLTVVETGSRHAVLRLPWSDRLAREGGGLSGQALMAAADTATVIAVASARGAFVPMTTVQQSTSFQRAVTGADVLVDARISKLGKRMAFADITMTAEGTDDADGPAARASTVYALLG
ncbi:PaaI family thioesterase [Streptomyces formicae]|uniref:PaaI family thioesterase n=1 Tax=Streptomyces formicae TaxID=1616117 RepID=A0ABY3WWR5_9ACTN|nr:PaaI family thioesterase [Streptomyces formicae]UNM15742.1 PaaI family thioesterase [Streptomyces formicae]